MTLPSRIQIGPWSYRVTDDRAEYYADSAKGESKLWGQIHYGLEQIILSPDQTEAHKRSTLLHEVLHGVVHLTDAKHETDEELIRSIAAPLLDVLRRNPGLVAYLMAEDEEDR